MKVSFILITSFLFLLVFIFTARAVFWDQMSGVAFSQPFQSTTLAYNVTAIAQSDPDGIGPAYLLNGLSNTGYWYQIGISYNWPTSNTSGSELTYTPGFQASYDVFDPNGTIIAPTCFTGNTCGGALYLSGPIHSGDKVLLSLSMLNGTVLMSIKDWNTGATAMVNFSSYGATEFQGTLYPPNYAGFFTGLMTEWYHNNAFYYSNGSSTFYNEQRVTYSPVGLIPTEEWLILFKICGPSSCLGSNSNLAFLVANVKGQGNLVVYTPENSSDLTQSELPYNFSDSDGQADNYYKNGTFATGTRNPIITTSITSTSSSIPSSSSSTTPSASTSVLTSTALSTTLATTIMINVQNTSAQRQAGQDYNITANSFKSDGFAGILIFGLMAVAIAALVVYFKRARPRHVSKINRSRPRSKRQV